MSARGRGESSPADAGAAGTRGQSHVVGVVVLAALAVVGLGVVTASVGTVVESSAAATDAARVADGFEATLGPATGTRTGTVAFSAGRLDTAARDLRVLNDSGVVASERVNALVFETGARRVAFQSGAITTRSRSGAQATFAREPPIRTADGDDGADDALFVGATALRGEVAHAASGGASVELTAETTAERRTLDTDRYRVAVETATPAPWRAYFEARNATIERRDLDGDGVASVVAAFERERAGYLVVRRTEVRVDG